MKRASRLKGQGYLSSTLSVVLLAIPGFHSASRDVWLFAALISGMILSITGMVLRWHSHRVEISEQDARRRPQIITSTTEESRER